MTAAGVGGGGADGVGIVSSALRAEPETVTVEPVAGVDADGWAVGPAMAAAFGANCWDVGADRTAGPRSRPRE